MDNATILVIVGIIIIVVIARKWDSFKWIFALALVVLAVVIAWQMGMFDNLISGFKTPKVEW